jgi:hypothetical protein
MRVVAVGVLALAAPLLAQIEDDLFTTGHVTWGGKPHVGLLVRYGLLAASVACVYAAALIGIGRGRRA